jgi:hypothetical protein
VSDTGPRWQENIVYRSVNGRHQQTSGPSRPRDARCLPGVLGVRQKAPDPWPGPVHVTDRHRCRLAGPPMGPFSEGRSLKPFRSSSDLENCDLDLAVPSWWEWCRNRRVMRRIGMSARYRSPLSERAFPSHSASRMGTSTVGLQWPTDAYLQRCWRRNVLDLADIALAVASALGGPTENVVISIEMRAIRVAAGIGR